MQDVREAAAAQQPLKAPASTQAVAVLTPHARAPRAAAAVGSNSTARLHDVLCCIDHSPQHWTLECITTRQHRTGLALTCSGTIPVLLMLQQCCLPARRSHEPTHKPECRRYIHAASSAPQHEALVLSTRMTSTSSAVYKTAFDMPTIFARCNSQHEECSRPHGTAHAPHAVMLARHLVGMH